MRSGIKSSKVKDINFREALKDPETRPIYIRRKFISRYLSPYIVLTMRRSPSIAMVD
jgi:Ras GTPase-activating-like protein IQGAP2/3